MYVMGPVAAEGLIKSNGGTQRDTLGIEAESRKMGDGGGCGLL